MNVGGTSLTAAAFFPASIFHFSKDRIAVVPNHDTRLEDILASPQTWRPTGCRDVSQPLLGGDELERGSWLRNRLHQIDDQPLTASDGFHTL